MNVGLAIVLIIVALLIGFGLGWFLCNYLQSNKMKKDRQAASELAKKAINDAATMKKESLLEAKEEIHKLKVECDNEIRERRTEIQRMEARILTREEQLGKREENLENKELSLDKLRSQIENTKKQVEDNLAAAEKTKAEAITQLEKVSGLTKTEAKKLIIDNLTEEAKADAVKMIREIEEDAKENADTKAREIITNAVQRQSTDTSNEITTSTVNISGDEIKGRLIGKEGRNIRSIEAATGVDLIIDDTPEAIVISSFDPLRREIAKVTIETLIRDGRIHPARIEELYDKVCNDVNAHITELGNQTINELGLTKVDPELVHLIGKLNFRTSYGQNVLQHSKEVAELCGIMASELGENVTLAKRAGLLHDIGKAIDYEVEGSHVELGVDIAKKFHEDNIVVNAIASHHGDEEQKSIIAVLVQVADTMSASRPGARNDSLENYIKRLEQLEEIGNSFEGVEKTYAMQAGREVRVMVEPGKVDDATSYKIARDMKEKIEAEMQYPGTIKITVIRETRAQEEAK